MSYEFPQSQDEFNERYMDTRPDDQEFKEIERITECGKNDFVFETVYQCSLCLKEHEKEECNCYE